MGIRKERNDMWRKRQEEKLERRICAASAERGKERERKKEEERVRERGKEEEGEEERKESWQLLGACGVGPFKARSPDARRRNCPPRVARALLVPLRHVPSTPPVATRVLRMFPLRAAPDTFLRRAQTVATVSMKSHPPRISSFLLPNLFFSLYPFRIHSHISPPSLREFGEHAVARDPSTIDRKSVV